MKRRNRSILGGKHIQFGNNVSERGKNKTRRYWLHNVQTTALYSEALGASLRLRVSTHVLKRCDENGGLDNYLLKTPDSLLHSTLAVNLKRRIIDRLHADGKLNHVLGLQSQYLPPGATYTPRVPEPLTLAEIAAMRRKFT